MDLGLGVLEEKRGDDGVRGWGKEEEDDDGDDDGDVDGSEDGREGAGGLGEGDALGVMMGKKRSRGKGKRGRAGIEEVGGV